MYDDSVYIYFLQNIIRDIETKNINPIQRKSIDEFYKIYNFLTEVNKPNEKLEIKDFIDFIVLIWFFNYLNERLCINSTLRIKN